MNSDRDKKTGWPAHDARAIAIADRIINEMNAAPDMIRSVALLSRALSWLAVKYPDAVEAALDYATERGDDPADE